MLVVYMTNIMSHPDWPYITLTPCSDRPYCKTSSHGYAGESPEELPSMILSSADQTQNNYQTGLQGIILMDDAIQLDE